MKFIVNTSQIESAAVTTARNTSAVDVTLGGGDSVAFVCVASAASSPTGATLQLQGSIDGTNFVNVGSTTSVTGNGSFTVGTDRPLLRWYRVAYAISSGSYTSTLTVFVKGDK